MLIHFETYVLIECFHRVVSGRTLTWSPSSSFLDDSRHHLFDILNLWQILLGRIPSGELTKSYGKIHHFSWENPLFLWPCSIAMLVHQRIADLATAAVQLCPFSPWTAGRFERVRTRDLSAIAGGSGLGHVHSRQHARI